MAEGSGVQVELASGAVPLFDQVLDMARLGIIPAGSYRNQDFFGPRVAAGEDLEPGMLDALYSPTDNTIAAGASQVGQICKENKLPYVTGEEGMCMAGGLFTLSINYEDLGYAAGEMAVKILKGEAKPEDMPIKHLSSKDLVVVKNDEMAEALGIDLSALDE